MNEPPSQVGRSVLGSLRQVWREALDSARGAGGSRDIALYLREDRRPHAGRSSSRRARPDRSAPPSGSGGLTPAQTRVADLVVEGLSNGEIAGALYMSVRSVEAHLTKAYRELGVRSRAQLVAALLADRPTRSNGSASDV